MGHRLRILVVDNEPLIVQGIRDVLRSQQDMCICGVAQDERKAALLVRRQHPDLILLETTVSRIDAGGFVDAVCRSSRQSRIIVRSSSISREHVTEVLSRGAVGYITKDTNPRSLPPILRAVAAGQVCISEPVLRLIIDSNAHVSQAHGFLTHLSNRERQVLACLSQGLTSKEIAQHLEASPRTIDAHRRSIMKKLRTHTTAGLIRYALREGLASPY